MLRCKIFIISAILSVGMLSANGQNNAVPMIGQDDVGVYFRPGERVFDLGYHNNKLIVDHFTHQLRDVAGNSPDVSQRILLRGGTSIDGDAKSNKIITASRTGYLLWWIMAQTGISSSRFQIINDGENWDLLKKLIQESSMPHRSDMLRLLDTYANDRAKCKTAMRKFASGVPWAWMSRNLFPELNVISISLLQGTSIKDRLSENWKQLDKAVNNAPQQMLTEQQKQAVLNIIADQDDAPTRLNEIKVLSGGDIYKSIEKNWLINLLTTISPLSQNNWDLLRNWVAGSDIANKDAILSTIDNVSLADGRYSQFMALCEQIPPLNAYVKKQLFEDMLSTYALSDAMLLLGDENWAMLRQMVNSTDTPHKDEVLSIITSTSDNGQRVRQLKLLNDGLTYNYLQQVFVPEILSALTPVAQLNWKQFRALVESSDIVSKQQVLDIVDNVSIEDSRIKQLKELNGGVPYRFIVTELLPQLLSNADATLHVNDGYQPSPQTSNRVAQARAEYDSQDSLNIERERQAALTLANSKEKIQHPMLAIKTNLLYDALLSPNIELEFFIGKRWSIALSYQCAWWKETKKLDYFYQLMALDLEARYWLKGDGQFFGHFLGLYVGAGYYDLKFSTDGLGYHGEALVMGGVAYGYSFKIGRNIGLELELGIGYMQTRYRTYLHQESCYVRQSTENLTWIGPTKAKISFVWRLGQKGGLR